MKFKTNVFASLILPMMCLKTYCFAQSSNQNFRYHGQVSAFVKTDWIKPFNRNNGSSNGYGFTFNGMKQLDMNLIVNQWGEGKIHVLMNLDSFSGGSRKNEFHCGGSQKTYVGYENASKTFTLYAKDDFDSLPTPHTAKAVGALTFVGSNAFLDLKGGYHADTGGKALVLDHAAGSFNKDSCEVTVSPDTSIQFERADIEKIEN